MTALKLLLSLFLGSTIGILYGISFSAEGLRLPKKETSPSKTRKNIFLSFFFFALLRILLIGFLWYFILRTQFVSIILVMLSFLVSFWIMILKRKTGYYERF